MGRRLTSRRAAHAIIGAVILTLALKIAPAWAAWPDDILSSSFVSIDAGRTPTGVAVGDLNADGRPDVVVSNYGTGGTLSGRVSVLLGMSAGAFAPRIEYSTGGNDAVALALSDLDENGTLDVVATDDRTGNLSVLLGNGDGTFQSSRTFYAAAAYPNFVVGDFDGDGHIDVVVPNSDGALSLVRGNGDGSFRPRILCATLGAAGHIAVGDVDGDGALDLAVARVFADSIEVLLGRGDGTFVPIAAFIAQRPQGVVIADVDGDHVPDLVYDMGNRAVAARRGNGDGSFGPADEHRVGGQLLSIIVADVDGDGVPDIVTANAAANTVSVLRGTGGGTFATSRNFLVGDMPVGTAVADWTSDGVPDLVVANEFSDTISLLGGLGGDGLFGAAPTSPTAEGPIALAIADVNADGKADVLAACDSASTVTVLLGVGNGTFHQLGGFRTGAAPLGMAVGDLDRDGQPDVVVACNGSGSVSVLRGYHGAYVMRADYPAGSFPTSVAIGDLDGDGVPDLAVSNYNAPTLSVLIGNGDGSFKPKYDLPTVGHGAAVAIADLNADGRADLVVTNYGAIVSVLLGHGDGTFEPRQDHAVQGVSLALAIGDLNGDGKPDLVVAGAGGTAAVNDYENTVSILLGNGDGTFAFHSDYPAGTYLGGLQFMPSAVAITDLEGDGIPDLVVAGPRANTVSVLRGIGDGTFKPKRDYGAGNGTAAVALADMDGDARPDVVAANFSGRCVSVMSNLTPGGVTPTLLSLFEGTWVDDGIALRWTLAMPAPDARVTLRRSGSMEGPWMEVAGQPRNEAGYLTLVDCAADRDAVNFYELVTEESGATRALGSIRVAPAMRSGSLVTLELSPNPARGIVHVAYNVATTTRVRLDIIDVEGRCVSRLVDTRVSAGSHGITWNGLFKGRPLAPGVYIVRFEAAGHVYARRLAWVQ